jgi:DNA topoisomerase-2
MALSGLTAKALKALCAEQGLAVSGTKSALVERLTAASSSAPAMETENAAPNPAARPAKSPAAGERAARYQKVEQREHILMRPDTYVGSVHEQPLERWVFDEATQSLAPREVRIVPALFKIFDEILVNASDNKQRDPKGMTAMKVSIDAAAGTISVRNNGRGVPIEMHREHGMYVPELIFGNLLTSDNYDDAHDKRTTGGRNGFGAKLTNIFSTTFTVETADSRVGKIYSQTWSANMTVKSAPHIEAYRGEDFTKITFAPDLEKFGLTEFSPDMVALLKKRVYDIAGVTHASLRVWLDGTKLAVKCFEQYVAMCRKALFTQASAVLAEGASEKRIAYCRVNDRWEIAVCASDGQFRQVSFVNSINTSKGGTHVKAVSDIVVKHLLGAISKKNKKGAKLTKNNVKNYLCIFVSCLIENPAFDSQTKETLNTRSSAFGSACDISPKFLKALCKADVGIVDLVLQDVAFRSRKIAPRASKVRNLTGIPKLDDANRAGTKDSAKCSMILTEGDSAKALAMSGLSVVGRDYYGVYPLKGKLLNVREAKHAQINKNMEIQNVIKILNIKRDVDYTNETARKSLRYGSVIIMADQDHDGSHIKGLVINFLQWFNCSLLKASGFVRQFITPIVKATQGRAAPISFYTLPQFEQWREELTEKEQRSLKTKYYKGLGTSTAKEAKEYFSQLDSHLIPFVWENGDERFVQLAFNKSRANERKDWLMAHTAGSFVDYEVSEMKYGNFFNREFILYSIASNKRAIPSVVDGLKPSQRKVLYACFKRNLKSDIKVAQLAGCVEVTCIRQRRSTRLARSAASPRSRSPGGRSLRLPHCAAPYVTNAPPSSPLLPQDT